MATEGDSSFTVKLELPKRVYDFIRSQAKQWNKTVEEYVDFCVQLDVASTLVELTMDERQTPDELAFDLELDSYIVEARKKFADYDLIPLLRKPQRRQPTEP
jgi:hypothetical protein